MSLRSLSDPVLLSRTHRLTRGERRLTRSVLLHLNEIERRRLHLTQGYASMWEYCTAGLGYSASAAARRIRTARCIARYPEVLALLEANAVNLSTVSQVSRVLSPGNRAVLLARIRGRSQREVEAIVAEFAPRPKPREVIRPIVVQSPPRPAAPLLVPLTGDAHLPVPSGDPDATAAAPTGARAPASSGESGDRYTAAPSCAEAGAAAGRAAPSGTVRGAETRTRLSFTAGEAFMAKLETVRSLAWHRLPANASLEQVFEYALGVVIAREDPAARKARREARASREARATRGERDDPRPPAGMKPRRRYVAPATRDQVLVRDDRRCTFVGPEGRRCGSRTALQVDHIVPVARGGPGTRDNLRVLCAAHNRLEAQRLLGTALPQR